MSCKHIDEVSSVFDEQNRYDQLEDSFSGHDFIAHDAATEVLFDATVHQTLVEEGSMEIDEELSLNECQCAGDPSSKQFARLKREETVSETGECDKSPSKAE